MLIISFQDNNSNAQSSHSSFPFFISLQLKYACTIGGCKKFTDDGATQTSQDILIVTRNTKTVRSVEMNSGSEKWVEISSLVGLGFVFVCFWNNEMNRRSSRSNIDIRECSM